MPLGMLVGELKGLVLIILDCRFDIGKITRRQLEIVDRPALEGGVTVGPLHPNDPSRHKFYCNSGGIVIIGKDRFTKQNCSATSGRIRARGHEDVKGLGANGQLLRESVEALMNFEKS